MPRSRSPDSLLDLFARRTVVDLPTIRSTLGCVSSVTAFHYLRLVPYRRSYNHNGRFYCLHVPSRYDRLGLWSHESVHFSVDGSLKSTARRLVQESEAGATHSELVDWLKVRAHNTLLTLVRAGDINRERVEAAYVYLHAEQSIGEQQLSKRREWVAGCGRAAIFDDGDVLVSDAVVIQVLLTLIHHPGSGPVDVRRRLRGHVPPIAGDQVRAVFTRYGLGEKGGPSKP